MKEKFLSILRLVSEVTDVSQSQILTAKDEESVDARHTLIYILSEEGFSDTKIAELVNRTRASVCISRNSFSERRRKIFVEDYYKAIRKQMEKD
ncbi:MAG: hypothetical protein MJZ30_09390 [Paludibacteraceae bacterium]|nr:hypothetical protein [Paludibacteraceae bacterium]